MKETLKKVVLPRDSPERTRLERDLKVWDDWEEFLKAYVAVKFPAQDEAMTCIRPMALYWKEEKDESESSTGTQPNYMAWFNQSQMKEGMKSRRQAIAVM